MAARPTSYLPRHDAPAARSYAFIAVALILGVLLWAWLGVEDTWTAAQLVGIAIAFALALFPPTRRSITARIDRCNAMRPPALRVATVAVFAAAGLYLLSTAVFQDRDLFPKWHDHQMTLLQAQMLARGRLWMPAHDCADFFETFYVFVKPVYAAMYFPGGALAFVPAVWTGIPPWLWSAVLAAAAVAVLFRVVAEMVSPATGLVAALLLVSLTDFRRVSVWPTSHHVFVLLALTAVRAWLVWRRDPGRRWAPTWAAIAGAALGWAAITRPVDAIAYALPLALAVAWDLPSVSWRRRIATIVIASIAAAPFLCLQLILNHKITGSFARTPVQHYGRVEVPGLEAYGPGADPASVEATSALPQKQLFARDFVIPLHQQFVSESRLTTLRRRAGGTLEVALPGALALLLLPLGIIGAARSNRWVLAITPVTFLAGYLPSPAFLSHYCVVAAPGLILCLVAAIDVTRRLSGRVGHAATVFVTLALAALGLGNLPELSGSEDDPVAWPTMYFNYERLAREVEAPAVVLFRFRPPATFHEEPVYNVDAAWPDDAPIVRAHDLGPRNREIIEYYARRQPGRRFYRFDRGDGSLTPLGTAAELAGDPGPATVPVRPTGGSLPGVPRAQRQG